MVSFRDAKWVAQPSTVQLPKAGVWSRGTFSFPLVPPLFSQGYPVLHILNNLLVLSREFLERNCKGIPLKQTTTWIVERQGNHHCDTRARASQRLTPHIKGEIPYHRSWGQLSSDPTLK